MYTYTSVDDLLNALVGHKIVATTEDTLTLDDGTEITLSSNDDCCSYVEVAKLATVDNIITSAYVGDNEDETGGEGDYKAWLNVVTEAGEVTVVEQDGDASNGYYLHGFALGIDIKRPDSEYIGKHRG